MPRNFQISRRKSRVLCGGSSYIRESIANVNVMGRNTRASTILQFDTRKNGTPVSVNQNGTIPLVTTTHNRLVCHIHAINNNDHNKYVQRALLSNSAKQKITFTNINNTHDHNNAFGINTAQCDVKCANTSQATFRSMSTTPMLVFNLNTLNAQSIHVQTHTCMNEMRTQ